VKQKRPTRRSLSSLDKVRKGRDRNMNTNSEEEGQSEKVGNQQEGGAGKGGGRNQERTRKTVQEKVLLKWEKKKEHRDEAKTSKENKLLYKAGR